MPIHDRVHGAVRDRGDLRIVSPREHLGRDPEIQEPQPLGPYGPLAAPQILEVRSPVPKRRAVEVPEELFQDGEGGFTGRVVSAGCSVLLEAFGEVVHSLRVAAEGPQ